MKKNSEKCIWIINTPKTGCGGEIPVQTKKHCPYCNREVDIATRLANTGIGKEEMKKHLEAQGYKDVRFV